MVSIIKSSSASDSISTMSLGSLVSKVKLPNGMQVTSIEMTEKLKEALPREDLKHNRTVYKNCFKADDAIKTFRMAFPADITSDQAAIAFGRMLQRARLMSHVCDPDKAFRDGHFFFRLQCFRQPEILNSYRICDDLCDDDVMDLLDLIASILSQVEQEVIDPRSGVVNFKMAHRSQFFPFLEDAVCKLQGLDIGTLNEATRFAVVVDLYNIMIKYAFMKVGVPDSRSTRTQFVTDVKMNIGGDLLSFHDLYHGILRGNRPPHGFSSGVFGAKDPRARLSLSKFDPRVHFCLNHTAIETSMPFICSATLQQDLQRETKVFLAKHTSLMIDNANRTVHLSALFKWYKSDFCNGDNMALLKFLEQNLEGGKKMWMQSLMDSKKTPKIVFADFDWGWKVDNFFPFKAAFIKANEKRLM